MERTQSFCCRCLFLAKSLSRVSPAQKPPGTGKAAGEEAFPKEKGRRKDFPSLQWVSPTLLALQHLLQVWDLPQSQLKGQGTGRVAFSLSTNVLTETPRRGLFWFLACCPTHRLRKQSLAGSPAHCPLPHRGQGCSIHLSPLGNSGQGRGTSVGGENRVGTERT